MVKILQGANGVVRVPQGRPGELIWTRTFFNAFIQKCKKAEVPLNPAYIRKHCSSALTVGSDIYGNWGNAMRKNGLRYEEVLTLKHVMPKDKIREAIRLRVKLKKSLLTVDVQKDDHHLWYSGDKQYGQWDRAVVDCGYDYAEIKRTEMEAKRAKRSNVVSDARYASIKEQVRNGIKTRSQAGLPITRWFVERQDNELFKKGKQAYHDDWKAAVKDAGFNYKEALLMDWPDIVLNDELQKMQIELREIDIKNAIAVFKANPDMYIVGITRHRTWKKALIEYGISLGSPSFALPSRFDSNGVEKPISIWQAEVEAARKKLR